VQLQVELLLQGDCKAIVGVRVLDLVRSSLEVRSGLGVRSGWEVRSGLGERSGR
jgi:hypothetical protein